MKHVLALLVGLSLASAASAQTRSTRDTATAYGARLTARGEPTDLNTRRVNNRVNTRVENRLSLRLERYRPDSTTNPTAAYRAAPNDGTRVAPTPPPPRTAPPDEGDDD